LLVNVSQVIGCEAGL